MPTLIIRESLYWFIIDNVKLGLGPTLDFGFDNSVLVPITFCVALGK